MGVQVLSYDLMRGLSDSAKIKRILVDHARAIAFLISDGVTPSNKEQGYVLRRLMRRVIIQSYLNNVESKTLIEILNKVVEIYCATYPNLSGENIIQEFNKENDKFQKTFKNGLKELEKLEKVDGPAAFKLFESYGLPYEIIKEIGGAKVESLTREEFEAERKRHQEISRAGVEKKFGSHGIKEGDLTAENSEEMKKVIQLHTATHILVAALKKVLGQELPQAGADITAERLRFDFTFPRKVTDEELQEAEKIANEIVNKDLPVTREEMPLDKAIKSGATAFFKLKYPEIVSVYTVGPVNGSTDEPFSREICGGPHVSHTAEIGHIKITKEESVSGGNRRIRAIVE